MYELWDLMSNVTLGNGVNALSFFHQVAKIITASGKVMRPSTSVMGVAGIRKVAPSPTEVKQAAEVAKTAEVAEVAEVPAKVAPELTDDTKDSA